VFTFGKSNIVAWHDRPPPRINSWRTNIALRFPHATHDQSGGQSDLTGNRLRVSKLKKN